MMCEHGQDYPANCPKCHPSIEDKITRVTFGRGSIKEGAEVTAYINELRSKLDEERRAGAADLEAFKAAAWDKEQKLLSRLGDETIRADANMAALRKSELQNAELLLRLDHFRSLMLDGKAEEAYELLVEEK